MGQALVKDDRRYTYADYLQWPSDERWELIGGRAWNMTPAPSRFHQEISGELFLQFATHLRGKQCRLYAAPFDVRLPAPGESGESTTSVVQPDLVVVCDHAKLDDRGCNGSPDLVIEILSPDSAARDLREKLLLYENRGVPEYWVVHPTDRTVMVFRLGTAGVYTRPQTYAIGDRIPVGILPDLEIDLATVFPG